MKRVVQYNRGLWRNPDTAPDDPKKLRGEFRRDIMHFHISSDDNEEMIKGLEIAFDVLKSVNLAVLDKMTDLNSCIDFIQRTKSRLSLCPFDEFVSNERYGYSNGLALIKAGYGVEQQKADAQKELDEFARHMDEGHFGYSREEFEKEYQRYTEFYAEQAAILEELSGDPRVFEELERVRAANIEKLRSYGLDA